MARCSAPGIIAPARARHQGNGRRGRRGNGARALRWPRRCRDARPARGGWRGRRLPAAAVKILDRALSRWLDRAAARRRAGGAAGD